jgi:putative phosphoesterase
MRVLVLSDSHDNIVRLKHVLGFAKRIRAAAIIHCGDWSSPGAVNTVGNLGIKTYGVLGNADVSPQMIVSLRKAKVKFNSFFLKLRLGGKRIGVCHYPARLEKAIESQKYDALFCGHIHDKYRKVVGKTLVVRPGAIGGTLFPSFAVYDTEVNDVEFIGLAI